MGRLVGWFRNGRGAAAPALILVWVALAAGLLRLSGGMAQTDVELHSGIVTRVTANAECGDMNVTIDASADGFNFNPIGFPTLPDLNVGDQVEMLTKPNPYGPCSAIALPQDVIAIQWRRGTWTSTYLNGDVSPFTPATWALHEGIRWSALVLGALIALFAVATLMGWVFSTRQPASVATGPSAADFRPEGDISNRAVSRAIAGIRVGAITVIGLPLLELLGLKSLGPCGAAGWAGWVLLVVPIALAGGGISAFRLGSSSAAGPQRRTARRLGILALALAGVTLAISAFVFVAMVLCGFMFA